MGKLNDRVAIVTGSASGIGRATAQALARAGASVVVADINDSGAKEVAKEITGEGGSAVAQHVDVGEEDSVRAMVQSAVSAFGGLDILHNNAAALGTTRIGRDEDVATMDVQVWDRTMQINLRGVMLGCKHAIPEMRKRGGGSIINTSSGSTTGGDLQGVAYASSKAGVNTLTLYVATQYGKERIRCNAVSPGLILTPAVKAGMDPEYTQRLEEHCLTPRLGEPEDIANTVVFLASDDASFITGQIIRVDGGIGSHLPPYAEMRRLKQG